MPLAKDMARAAPQAALARLEIVAEDAGAVVFANAVRHVEPAPRLVDDRIVRHADARRSEALHARCPGIPAKDRGMLQIAGKTVPRAVESNAKQKAIRAAHALDRAAIGGQPQEIAGFGAAPDRPIAVDGHALRMRNARVW